MKKKFLYPILLLTLTHFSNNINAQSSITNYDTCFATRQFNGEWRNVNGLDTIKVYFRTHIFYSSIINKYEGEVLGWHEYKIGGQIIQSDYSHRFDFLPLNFTQKYTVINSTGLRFPFCSDTINNLYGGMIDVLKNKKHQIWKVTRVTANTIRVDQMQGGRIWNLPYISGYTLPQSFVLTKQ
jgi:hypothetical protein